MEYFDIAGRGIMFINDELNDHLQQSGTVKSEAVVISEWNLNTSDNISLVGNYRYRPLDQSSKYSTLPNTFDVNDTGNFYTNATDADVLIDGGFDTDANDNAVPVLFQSKKDKEKLLYSLEDCFSGFRPRSGINKARYFNQKFLNFSSPEMSKRPRYYMADKTDKFKYWTSYRTESGYERGVSYRGAGSQNYIDDTAPFVVYKNEIMTNRIVVKMQTHVGTIDLGPFSSLSGTVLDPFFGAENASIPERWKIQYLKDGNWIDAIRFNKNSKRKDGTDIIKPDGYLEISYGLIVPDEFLDTYTFCGEYTSASLLPESSTYGYSYLVKDWAEDSGTMYIWNGSSYTEVLAKYGWQLSEESVSNVTHFVKDIVSPDYYTDASDGTTRYREFEYIQGLRIVVDSMNSVNATFDLIELSPRLLVDLSERTLDISLTKSAADQGNTGLPLGNIMASVGSISLFDYDDAFNIFNENSIISKYVSQNIKFVFYEKIIDVNGYDYYVPLKTMYSDGFPEKSGSDRKITLKLRDLYYRLESTTAPELFLQDVSLSFAVSTLLDYIGFSNYVFKRAENEQELIIPSFYIDSGKSVAEALTMLAASAQCAMFFDEYNNFVVMSKGYMLPKESDRSIDATLRGTKDFSNQEVIKNIADQNYLSNIVDISQEDTKIFNAGKIIYSNKYIQKSYGSIAQASLVDRDKTWIYKPVLLWESSGSGNSKPINNESSRHS